MSNSSNNKSDGQLQVGTLIAVLLVTVAFFTKVFTIEEPTDKGCVKVETISQLKDTNIELGTVCKSLDKMNQTMQVFDKRDQFDAPIYNANEFINESVAAQKNAIQESLYAAEDQRLFKDIRKILANEYLVITTIIIFGFIVIRLKNTSKIDYLIKTLIPIVAIVMLLVMLENSNTFKVGLNRMIQSTGNSVFHLIAKKDIKNFTKNEDVLIDSSFVNAYSDLSSLYSIGVCMSNNQKNHITWLEIEGKGFDSKSEMTDFYDNKLNPYFVEYESANNRKVKYHVDRDLQKARLKGVTFQDCGYVDFANKNFSKELSFVLENVGFERAMKMAVSGNDYEAGWNILDEGFDKAYAINHSNSTLIDEFLTVYAQDDDYDNIKKQLLIYYTVEYKKALLFGNVATTGFMKYPSSDVSNFTNFQKHMKNAEKWYDLVNKSVCIENDHLILDTQNKLISSDFENTNQLGFYYCMDFNDESITINHNKYYNPDDEKIDKKVALENAYKESKDLFLNDVNQLASEYKAVNDKFIEIVQTIYDLDKKAIRLWNEGFVSRAKFYNHLKQSGFGYTDIFREIIGINNFNIDLSVKSYYSNAGMESDSNYNLYTESVIRANMPPVDNQSKIESQLETGRVSSDLFRDQFGSQDLNSNQEPSDMWDVFDAVQNRTVNSYKNVQRMFCASTDLTFDRERCITESINGAGNQRVSQLADDMKVLGVTSSLSGFSLKLVRQSISLPVKILAENKKSKGKAVIGKATKAGKNGLSKVGAGMAGASKVVEDTMILTGFVAYIGGNLMTLASKLSEIVSVFFNVSLGIFAENITLMLYGAVLCRLLLVWKKDNINHVLESFYKNVFSVFLKLMFFIAGLEIFMIIDSYLKNNIFQMSDWLKVDSPTEMILTSILVFILFSFGTYKIYAGITSIFDKYDTTGAIRTTVDDTMNTVQSVMSMKQSLLISKATRGYMKLASRKSKNSNKNDDQKE